jgi:hypothetical protein
MHATMRDNNTIYFACHNHLQHPQQFLGSLNPVEIDFSCIVAINKGLTNGTREWLQTGQSWEWG